MARTLPRGASAQGGRARAEAKVAGRARPRASTGRLNAIDLYAGVGGWALGLKMAGIDTRRSYEWWDAAAKTHAANFGSPVSPTDIRKLRAVDVPQTSFIVGSPPCTQFSFANRGGGGDITEGLRDVEKFLRIVEAISPTYWVMENVPRVAAILERELAAGGSLRRFAKLVSVITIVDMAEYGLPQSRKRMLAGHFPMRLLESYRAVLPRRTLGDVISALSDSPVRDPIYGFVLPPEEVTGSEREPVLTDEEVRMNREAKSFHPVYNRMSFPDVLNRPSRTVTATCTRVSRESVVVPAGSTGTYRRLTLRERASLQGFPITFQFYGKSYNDNLKMVGNAIPPLMTYYVAHSVIGTSPTSLPAFDQVNLPVRPMQEPDRHDLSVKARYSHRRTFRAAIPNLRFGSGVRFELTNVFARDETYWRIAFYFGTSKNILRADMGAGYLRRLRAAQNGAKYERALRRVVRPLDAMIDDQSGSEIQQVWTHEVSSGLHPHQIVDELGRAAERLHVSVSQRHDVEALVYRHLAHATGHALPFAGKLRENADWLFVGFLLGSWLNTSCIAGTPRQLSLVG